MGHPEDIVCAPHIVSTDCTVKMMIAVGLLLHALLVTVVHSTSLAGLKDNVGTVAWSAEGGVSSSPFKVFNPAIPATEWKIFGQRCQLNYNEKSDVPIRRYREQKAGSDFLRKPDGFQFIWDDRMSTVSMDGSVWRVNCPLGYVSLGDLFYAANRINSPTPLFNTVACVKADLTEDCVFGGRIWFDKGTWAYYDLSVWEVKASDQQISYFYCNNNHDGPPGLKPKCLKKSAILDLMFYNDAA